MNGKLDQLDIGQGEMEAEIKTLVKKLVGLTRNTTSWSARLTVCCTLLSVVLLLFS